MLRREDRPHLLGRACFTDDIERRGAAHAVVVRSPHAHARIRRVDTAPALAMPGVLCVLDADALAELVPHPIPSFSVGPPFGVRNRDDKYGPDGSQPVLARSKVRFVGEPVAFVVAESLLAARDAAEAVIVDYEPLPCVMTFDDAMRPHAPRLWEEHPDNGTLDWECGDREGVDAAFASAARRVSIAVENNRVVAAFMEPRSSLAEPAGDRLVLYTGSQTAHRLQSLLAGMMERAEDSLRVVTPDTGGGFGARGTVYPEDALVLAAAARLGRPVRWTADRSESFLTDWQARDHLLHGTLALDDQGRFTALRVKVDWRHGGYLGARNTKLISSFLPPTATGVYRIASSHVHIRGAFTNTTPHSAYRGVGRVETAYLIESLVDAAARETGIDRIELRRRNLLHTGDLPWSTDTGGEYHACDFAHCMDRALAHLAPSHRERRRADALARRRLYGAGIAVYVENDGGAPSEYAEVEARADGEVQARMGTQDFGMGHQTTFAQILGDVLGVPMEQIRIIEGDTDAVTRGSGSHGSRSLRVGGTALVMGARRMVERGRDGAADLLEAAIEDVEYDAGRFVIAGTDRAVTLAEVAVSFAQRDERLAADADFDQTRESYSSGCHVCEVEIDPDTGKVDILAHVVVADVGRAVNPMIVAGQIHGGAAQGLGQAALERVAYDPETGQTLSGSFMDYAIPRADDLPPFTTEIVEVAETDNPLRAKGIGEGPTTGAPAAFMNAVRDALGEAGKALQMPATPERVWRCLRDARSS